LTAALAEARRELAEARRREAATAAVLNVISRSKVGLDVVLATLTEQARTLCGASNATVHMRDGDLMRLRAQAGCSRQFLAWLADNPVKPQSRHGQRTRIGRAPLTGEIVEISDVCQAPDLEPSEASALGNYRAILAVPITREGRVEGVFSLARPAPGRFPKEQIELIRTFADQAMIAIENARLFNETQDALKRETATSEILRVISQSPTDARPVFDAIVSAAVRSLRCDMAAVLLRDGDVYDHIAGATTQGLMKLPPGRPPIDPSANFPSRAFLAKETLNLPDWSQIDLPEHERNIQAALGVNSALYLPPLREGGCIGLLVALGTRANAFGPKEITHAESFRDQALIAIENTRLFDETQEAPRQQTATADILKVIASSPNNLQPVLDKIVETTCRLCSAYDALVLLREGDRLRPAAHYGPIPITFASQEISRGWAAGRAVIEGRAIHIDDFAKQIDEYPVAPVLASAAGSGEMLWRAALVMPLMREGEAIGVIGLRRAKAVAFSEGQIELLKTFSDQAVIAIENVRLFYELQAKTRDLEEALGQQTATTDVLKVISRSAFDLNAVLATLTASARSLSGAASATVMLREGELLRIRAESGCPPEFFEYVNAHPPGEQTVTGRVVATGESVHVPDVLADAQYSYGLGPQIGNYRAIFGAPLIRNGKAEGAFALMRPEPGAFTDRQIELLKTFADQAMIAIENARLFEEVEAKTRDLAEALAQRTATADVLKVISRSAFDLDAVLKTLTDSARSLSGASLAAVFMTDGDVMRIRAESGFSPALIEYAQARPIRAGRETFTGRAALSGEVVHIPDVLADPDYDHDEAPRLGDYRAGIGVPLLRAGRVDGVFALVRLQPGAFTPRQIEMARAFADQAVIAIENARLFNEVQAKTRDLEESLKQQTATADVLKVISRSAFDLRGFCKRWSSRRRNCATRTWWSSPARSTASYIGPNHTGVRQSSWRKFATFRSSAIGARSAGGCCSKAQQCRSRM
jgi:GAF domain-containing protein